jgi:hypothetical protein
VKEKSIDAFDYLVVAFLNVGFFYGKRKKHGCRAGAAAPEFFTLPALNRPGFSGDPRS